MLSPERILPRDHAETIEWWGNVLVDALERDREEDTGTKWYDKARRWLCRNDLFYLLVRACNRTDMNHPWLFDRCREVQLNPNGHLDLWARDHYKSTIITFGLSLQDILASHGEDPEPRYGGREVTIGILSFNRPTAKSFLRQIKREMEDNDDLKALFPDILWEKPAYQAPKWSEDDGLVVRRKTNPKEATVEASGLVDGMPTGKHFFILAYDDVVTRESVYTPDMIEKTTSAWELSNNLSTEGGWKRYIGTRYHLFDTYATMMERGIPNRTYPCTSDGSEDFEEKAVLKSPEHLREKRREQGPFTFGAQMLLDPVADTAQGFKEEWLERWPNDSTAGLNTYILVDPASKKKKDSDYTSMWVIGAGADKNYYVIDGVHDRLNLKERQTALFELHRRYRPLAVAYEEYGSQADIEHMAFVMDQENYRFVITPVGGKLSKEDRIRRLVPKFESGRVFLPRSGIVKINYEGVAVDICQEFINKEYLAFPVCQHDDQLDCLSRLDDINVLFPAADASLDPEMPKWMADHLDDGEGDWYTA